MQPLEPKITIEVTKFETKFFFVMIIDSQSSKFLHRMECRTPYPDKNSAMVAAKAAADEFTQFNSLANEFEATVLAGSHAEPVH